MTKPPSKRSGRPSPDRFSVPVLNAPNASKLRCERAIARYSGSGTSMLSSPVARSASSTCAMRSAFANGSGRSMNVSIAPNMYIDSPRPAPSIAIAVSA